MDIVYRLGMGSNGWDSVVFAELSRAERVVQIKAAPENSTTWGEFRRALREGANAVADPFDDMQLTPVAH